MKSKVVNSITNNEDYVRMRIFDGEFTPNEAYEELLRIEKEQRKSDQYFNDLRINYILGHYDPRRKDNMNDIIDTQALDPVTGLPITVFVEGEGETSPTEATVFIAEDSADHEVTGEAYTQ